MRTAGMQVSASSKLGEMTKDIQAQAQRTFLRERFLRMLGSISGAEAKVKMQEKTKVVCKMSVADVDFHHIHVTDLSTPMGVIPHATLRTSDVVYVSLPQVSVEKTS